MKFIIEHMEPEVYEWCQLEYKHMLEVVGRDNLIFTKVSQQDLESMPEEIKSVCTEKSVIEMGIPTEKICLLDQNATQVLEPSDIDKFDYVLFGGILGDEDTEALECIVPDRTSELRQFKFPTRHLGINQMTTDGAVLVSKMILKDKIQFEDIQFIDHPEIKLGKNESTIMPFRYVKDKDGEPTMAKGMKELLKKQSLEF